MAASGASRKLQALSDPSPRQVAKSAPDVLREDREGVAGVVLVPQHGAEVAQHGRPELLDGRGRRRGPVAGGEEFPDPDLEVGSGPGHGGKVDPLKEGRVPGDPCARCAGGDPPSPRCASPLSRCSKARSSQAMAWSVSCRQAWTSAIWKAAP